MRLGATTFVAGNPANAGQDMYAALMGPASPVPAAYITVTAASVGLQTAVPAATAAQFHPAPGVAPHPVPNDEAAFLAARKPLQDRLEREAICVHQRGYAVTDPLGQSPLLSTMSIAPCIVLIVRSPHTSTSALAHVDANQRADSVANVIGEFPAGPLDLFFHGGLTGVPQSQATCEGLLQALFTIEAGVQRFTVREFDVQARPHGREVTFDSTTGTVHPGFAPQTTRYDTLFRILTNGTYLGGAATVMAGACEDMVAANDPVVAAAGVAARDIRKQFDGQANRSVTYLRSVETAVYTTIATLAVQRAAKGSAATVRAIVERILRGVVPLDVVEANLRFYMNGEPGKAGDKRYLVEALVAALMHGTDPEAATKTWAANVPH